MNVSAEQCWNCLWVFHSISASSSVISWFVFAERRNHATAHPSVTHMVGTKYGQLENMDWMMLSTGSIF